MINLTKDTPLYNYPLPKIEMWLKNMGCNQNQTSLNHWYIKQPSWEAHISLEIEELVLSYLKAGADGSDITRAFRYSLSLQDIEDAVFCGP